MFIFKRISLLERSHEELIRAASRADEHAAKLGLELTRTKEDLAKISNKLMELNAKLPAYEDAIAKGVGEEWNKAVQSVIDYNPFARKDHEVKI